MSEAVESLKPLIEKARRAGKWLHCAYQDLWFSPEQLEQHNAAGRFRWGAVNWSLRDPQERLKEMQRSIDKTQKAFDRFKTEISNN